MSAVRSEHKNLPSLDYGLGAGVALLVAGLIGFGLAQAGGQGLNLEVYGPNERVSVEQVQDLLALDLAQGFFQIDVEAVENRLQALPWVRAVQVQRLWPNRLALHVQEHEPLASWGESQLLTRSGDLIEPAEALVMPLAIDAPSQFLPAVLDDLRQLAEQGGDLRWQRWQMSEAGDRRADAMWGDQALALQFGREEISQALNLLLQTALPALQERQAQVAAVDLRYRNGFAVRWLTGAQPGKTEQ